MPARNAVPFSQRCARCDSARKVEGSAYCISCRRIAERSIAVPGRDVAAQPTSGAVPDQPVSDPSVLPVRGRGNLHDAGASPEPYPEAEQDRDLRELSRCPECQTTFGGHLTSCSKTFDALDFWGAEWASEEDVG